MTDSPRPYPEDIVYPGIYTDMAGELLPLGQCRSFCRSRGVEILEWRIDGGCGFGLGVDSSGAKKQCCCKSVRNTVKKGLKCIKGNSPLDRTHGDTTCHGESLLLCMPNCIGFNSGNERKMHTSCLEALTTELRLLFWKPIPQLRISRKHRLLQNLIGTPQW